MKKILLIVFLIFFSFGNSSISYGTDLDNGNSSGTVEGEVKEESQTGTIEKNEIEEAESDEDLLKFVNARKNRIEKILGVGGETESEKIYKDIIKQLKVKNEEESIVKELAKEFQEKNSLLLNEIKEKNENIIEKNKEIDDKVKEIEKLNEDLEGKSDYEKLSEEKSLYLRERNTLKKQKKELEERLKTNTSKLKLNRDKEMALEDNISELLIYKNRYEKLLKDEEGKKIENASKELFTYVSILVLFVLFGIISRNFIKNKHNKAVFSVSATILFFLTIIAYTLAMHPSFLILFIIIASSLVLTFRQIILSVIGSIFILSRYTIGDLIEIKGKEGKIVKVNSASTILKTKEGFVTIGNHHFITENATKLHKEKEEEFEGTMKLEIERKELHKTISKIIECCKDIQNDFDKNKNMSYAIENLENGNLKLEIKLKSHNVSDSLIRIFHKGLIGKIVEKEKETNVD